MKNDNKTWVLKVPTSTRLHVREQAKKAKIGMSEWVEKLILEASNPQSNNTNSPINVDIISKQLHDLSKMLYNHIHSPKKRWFS